MHHGSIMPNLARDICIPSSTSPPHRPHLRGPNEKGTSYQGRLFSRTERSDRSRQHIAVGSECETTVVAGSVGFSTLGKKKREKKVAVRGFRCGFMCARAGHVGLSESGLCRPVGCLGSPESGMPVSGGSVSKDTP